MAKKTFKLGERCAGNGNITVEITGKIIKITCNGKTGTAEADEKNAYRKIQAFLMDFTSAYHSGKIADWIVGKANVEIRHFWDGYPQSM